jgi:hypothetical protein
MKELKKRKSGFTHDVKSLNTAANILAVRITHEMFPNFH